MTLGGPMSAYEEMMAQRGDAGEPKGPTEPPEGQDTGPTRGRTPRQQMRAGRRARPGAGRRAHRGAERRVDCGHRLGRHGPTPGDRRAQRRRVPGRGQGRGRAGDVDGARGGGTPAERGSLRDGKLHAESEKARDEANQAIASLRDAEREHRERMKTHLQEMLAKVEANSIA